MDLSDFLPDNLKEGFADRNLKVGTVLKLYVNDTNPPKEKRFIIVGSDSEYAILATVYINSDINMNVNFSEDLKKLQLSFDSENREYLDHDSFVDCSKLQFKDSKLLKSSIIKNPASVIGELNDEDYSLVKQTIIDAKTIKGKHKKRFGFYD